MSEERTTALLLLPKRPSEQHIALFELIARKLQFELVRPDEGDDWARCMLEASFVLADVSGNHPEVLYYVGVAHTFGKRVFLSSDTLATLPYDLASSRTWVIDPYSDNLEIQEAMAQFLSVPHASGPVRLFLGKFAFFGENLIMRRFLAFAIDATCLLLLLALALHVVVGEDQESFMQTNARVVRQFVSGAPVGDAVIGMLTAGSYVALGYFVLSTWLFRATLGQFCTRIVVVQADHRRVTFGQCVGRAVLLVLVLWTVGASFLWAIRGPGHRAAHDVLSGTICVRKRPLRSGAGGS